MLIAQLIWAITDILMYKSLSFWNIRVMKKFAPHPKNVPTTLYATCRYLNYVYISFDDIFKGSSRLNTQNQQHAVPFTIRCIISLLYGNNITFIALH